MTGQILLRMGRGREAAEHAKFVADRWFGADHNEAVELWNSVPEGERPAGVVVLDWNPKEAQRAEGMLKGVTCGEKEKWDLAVAQGEQILNFHRTGGFFWGFSDTIWYGQNHINLCHNLEGRRTIVYFKPPSNSSYTGDVVEFEIRDDLPAAPKPPGNTASVKGAQ